MTSTSKISVYSLSDLKNTTDDALPNYLKSLKFTQSHTYTDIRLALGYTAVAIAGAAFYLDYTQGFEKTKTLTTVAVIAYFALNSALTYWIWGVERGTIFTGESSKGGKIELGSWTKKHVPVYHLRVRTTAAAGKAGGKAQEKEIEAPFTRWFTQDGVFVAKPFQQWLASEVEMIGEVDPGNVVEEIGRGNQTDGVRVSTGSSLQDVLSGMKQGASGGGGGSARNRRKG